MGSPLKAESDEVLLSLTHLLPIQFGVPSPTLGHQRVYPFLYVLFRVAHLLRSPVDITGQQVRDDELTR